MSRTEKFIESDNLEEDRPTWQPEDETKNIVADDFVVARIYGESDRPTSVGRNYVAQVTMEFEEVILVKFLERKVSLSKAAFVFPDIIDEATVLRKDILCRLPPPSCGTTLRTKGLFTFQAISTLMEFFD